MKLRRKNFVCAKNSCVFTFGVFHLHLIFLYFPCIHSSCVSQKKFFSFSCSINFLNSFLPYIISLHRYTFYICILCRLFFSDDDDDVYNIRLIANIPGVSSISIRRRHTYIIRIHQHMCICANKNIALKPI